MDKKLLKQLEKWHKNLGHEKIISAVLEIPAEIRDYELTSLLQRRTTMETMVFRYLSKYLLTFADRGGIVYLEQYLNS